MPAGSKPPDAPRVALDALLAGAAGGPLRRAMWLDAMDHLLRPHLPASLAAHARLANIDGTRLVFLVDSPAWHARVRLAAPALIDAARSIGLEVADVVVRTRRPSPAPAAAPPRPVPPSATATQALRDALASLRDDGEPPRE